MVLHVFTSFLGGVPLCIPYGSYSETSLGGTTWRTLEGHSGRVHHSISKYLFLISYGDGGSIPMPTSRINGINYLVFNYNIR